MCAIRILRYQLICVCIYIYIYIHVSFHDERIIETETMFICVYSNLMIYAYLCHVSSCVKSMHHGKLGY